MQYPLLGVFGGTFDPIHCGHLHIVKSCDHALHFRQVLFIPNKTPPHRVQPAASPKHRLAMVKAAIADEENFKISTLELEENGPSFAIQTLRKLSAEHPKDALCFILGTDAFATFQQWYGHEKILDYCHLIIVNRPNFDFSHKPWCEKFIKQHQTHNAADLHQQRHGLIYLQQITPTPTSATEARARLATGLRQHIDLPDAVKAYIQTHELYRIGNEV